MVMLALTSVLILSITSICSAPVTAITDWELTQRANGIVNNMTLPNATHAGNLQYIMENILRLQARTYINEWETVNQPPLESKIQDIKNNVDFTISSLDTLEANTGHLDNEIIQLKSRITAQEEKINQLQARINTIQNSQGASLASTLGTAFKTLGETLISMSTNTPAPSNPEPAPAPEPAPSIPETPTTGTSTELIINPSSVSINKPAEPGYPISSGFDGSTSTYFAKSYMAAYPASLMIDFGSATTVTEYQITSRNIPDNLMPGLMELYTSDDGNTFTYRGQRTIPVATSGNIAKIDGVSSANRYHRLTFIEKKLGDPKQLQFAELKAYGYR